MVRNLLLILIPLMVINIYPQVEDRLTALNESQISKFMEPMSTAIGVTFNSGTYSTAEIPLGFRLSLGVAATVLFIPESQTTFTPDLPPGYINERPTATIFGDEGGYYAGPDGYIVYPPGINRTTIPGILPQAAVSVAGTRLLVRYLPPLTVGETEVSMFGVGLSHSITQYFPLFPVELAVQGLYNTLTVKNIADQSNFAVNIHGSKEFGLFTLYSGIQYERSSMDLGYTFKVPAPLNPNQFIEREIKASLKGKNQFRFTAGGSIKIVLVRIHGDVSAGPQFSINTGLSLELN